MEKLLHIIARIAEPVLNRMVTISNTLPARLWKGRQRHVSCTFAVDKRDSKAYIYY